MSSALSVSVIIPVIKINDYIRESVPRILELDWPDFEILIVPDCGLKCHPERSEGSLSNAKSRTNQEILRPTRAQNDIGKKGFNNPKVRIIPSGPVGPAEKRDLAAEHARGDILAFLDDDAYPRRDWLKRAVKHFSSRKVAAVGGPAITPSSDTAGQKISGAVFESYLGGGGARNRYLSIGRAKEIDDWPTVNLLVRKDVFVKIGGFDCAYWPGEDTKLCLDIVKAGHNIIYEPYAVVYHHRRAGVLKHLKQIGNYALHRGYFAKKHPQNSLKLAYFIPTLFVLYLVFSILDLFGIWDLGFGIYFSIPIITYVIGLFIDATIIGYRWKNIIIGLATIPIIFLTHLWYGVRFVWGLVLPKLKK